jgi:outer membrane protein TolC
MTPAVVTAVVLGLALSLGSRRVEAQRVRLTIDDAVSLATKQGYSATLANARLASADAHERGAAADLLPQLSVTGNHLRSSGRTTIVIPQGALGNESSGSPLPATDRRFDQGAAALTYTQFSVIQPVTQLWRIRQAQGLATAQTRGAAAERSRTQADVRLAIERLYASVLIAEAKEHAAELTLKAARRQSSDAQQAVTAGNVVSANALGVKATALDAELAWTAAADSASDAESELRSALALKPGTRLELVAPETKTDSLRTLDEYVANAVAGSPEVAIASAAVEQAHRASNLARADFIPDVGVGVTYTMLNGVSFLPKQAVGFSVQGSWTIWDWGKRSSLTRARAANESAATTALALARDRVSVEVERAYRFAERAQRAAEVAKAAAEARRASLAVLRDRCDRGLTTTSAVEVAEAEVAQSETRVLAAELQIRVARAELARAIGAAL